MTDQTVDDIIRQLVLAHADGEIQAIAVVMVNVECAPEIKYAINHGSAYAINFGLDVIKAGLLKDIIKNAGEPGKDRE